MDDEIKRKNGRRLSVASFEDKQEAMEIIDLVLAPVCHITKPMGRGSGSRSAGYQ